MKKFNKPVTAAELLARLAADPSYVARQALQEQEMQQRIEAIRAEQRVILNELLSKGIRVHILQDLISMPTSDYEVGFAILLRHLQLPYSEGTRETIARALAVKEAAPHWDTLRKIYQETPAPVERGIGDAKDGLAAALTGSMPADRVDKMIELVKDTGNGSSRLLLLRALRRSRQQRARDAIDQVADDPDLCQEIASWRKRKKSPK